MSKLYYLGTGTEFVKAQCKEYKTIEGALKAAAKDESLVVWDENGNVIGSLTDDVPDGATNTNADGSVNAYDADGKQVGTVGAETVAAATGQTSGDDEQTSGENDKQTAPQDDAGQDTAGENDAEGATGQADDENAQNGANTASNGSDEEMDAGASKDGSEGQQDSAEDIKEERGTFHVEVVCDGSLRLRRSASFIIDNECGRASKGQTYVGTRVFMCDGLPMVETVDGLFLSAAAEHVKIEKVG